MRVRECKLDRHDYFAGTIRALFSICLCLGRTRDKARRKVHRSTHCHRRRQIGVHKPISSDVAPETIFRNAPTRNDTSADVNTAAPVPLLFEAIKRFFFSLLSTHSSLFSRLKGAPELFGVGRDQFAECTDDCFTSVIKAVEKCRFVCIRRAGSRNSKPQEFRVGIR